MEQQIRFCTAPDGVRIAYATAGEGPPLVYVCGWPQHLELEWESPFARRFLEELASTFTLVRYDMRGSGLSDRNVSDVSLESLVRDLEGVVDHLDLETFPLLSLGTLAGPIAIHYAAEHPERVTHLVLLGAFLRGDAIAPPDRQRALIEYAAAFGFPIGEIRDEPVLDRDEEIYVRRTQKAAVEPEVQGALLRTMFSVNVEEEAQRIAAPALVMHSRRDPQIRFELGREAAARLPHASFVPFEADSPAVWHLQEIIIPEIRRFLGVEAAVVAAGDPQLHDVHTILFTDIEGSTALNQRLGDAKARELLREHERIVRESLRVYGGSEVKTMGDGFMASFPSATRALECAIALQRAFAEWNAGVGATGRSPLYVRCGLNAGEPIAEGKDLFGTAVIVAARIAAQAKGGEILAANVVRELAAGKTFTFASRGRTVLRGFEEPVEVFQVRWEG